MTNSYNDTSEGIILSPTMPIGYVPFEYNRCHWQYKSNGKYQTECNSLQSFSLSVLKCPNCNRLMEVLKKRMEA